MKEFCDISSVSYKSQLNFDTISMELVSDPMGKGSVQQDHPHFRCQLQVQGVICASDQLAINWRFLQPSTQVQLIRWSSSQNSGN